MKEYTLQKAQKEDAATILALIKELAEFEELAHEVVATEEQILSTVFAENSNIRAVIAKCDGKCVGYMIYFLNYSTFLSKLGIYLEDLYVSPEYRGIGMGKAFLKYLANEAIKNDYGRIEWSVLNWNPAREFYEALGAKAQDEWTVYRLTGDGIINLAKD